MTSTGVYSDGGTDPDKLELPPSVSVFDAGQTQQDVLRIWVYDTNANAIIVYEKLGALSGPSNLSASPSGDRDIALSWTLNSSTEDRVVVEYSDDEGSTWNHLVDLAAETTSYTDQASVSPTLTDGQRRDYRVKVEKDTNDGVESSPYSNTDSAITNFDAPQLASATAISASEIEIDISSFSEEWDAIEIYRSDGGSAYSQIDTINNPTFNDFPYTDSGLNSNTEYCYKLKGIGPDAETNFSNIECATTSSPSPETLRPNADVGGTMTADWSDTDGNGDGWDELDEATPDGSTTAITASVSSGNSKTVQHGVELGNPTEVHNDTQTWTVQVQVSFSHGNCGSGGSFTVSLEENATLIREETYSPSTDGYNTYTFTLTATEINSIGNLDDLEIHLESTIASPCCSNCSTEFPVHGSESISWSQAELDIS